MKSIKSKVSYLNGLIDGLGIDSETKEGKVICEIGSVLFDISDELCRINEENKNLKEYINQIDNDLSDVEDEIYGVYDDIDDGSDYNEDDFKELECPNCGEPIYIEKSLFDDKTKLECPNCRYGIVLEDEESTKAE
ncbi:CD1247 N-terminal domain-containing protein [Haloimpatiens sp. FM7330]|uniref:CD1247 N-terminal domain-containing protein n=1 Tax=Haloimpatiens sp. FM7330 TaxID=3298610 RepID=UPI00362F7664